MRSVKEILANEKFQANKKNDFAFEGLVLTGFLHLPGIKKSLQCVVGVEPDQDGNQWEHVSVKFCGTTNKRRHGRLCARLKTCSGCRKKKFIRFIRRKVNICTA